MGPRPPTSNPLPLGLSSPVRAGLEPAWLLFSKMGDGALVSRGRCSRGGELGGL